jgi:hypothetical protein
MPIRTLRSLSASIPSDPLRRPQADLAGIVDDEDLGQKLRTALANEITLLGLDVPERETILRALEAPPAGVEELRAVLLREHVGRVRDGLV